jgi:hypothetical protein
MFNLYEFEKRVKHDEDILHQQLKDEKIHENLRSKLHSIKNVTGKNEILAKNYKTRVAHFIKQVSGFF